MNFTISEESIEYKDRIVVKVYFEDGTFQPFYKSTGKNSQMPGEFLPFDGLDERFDWFIKTRFTYKAYAPIHRYGNEFLMEVSNCIKNKCLDLQPKKAGREEVNKFLFNDKTPLDLYKF